MEPLEFEIACGNDRSYIRVYDMFVHHYTGEVMRYLRIESTASSGNGATAKYTIVNDGEFQKLLSMRKV